MSKATNDHTTPTRRTALRLSAAAIVAGITAPVMAAANPADAELIAACVEAVRCEARYRHIDQHGTTDEDCADALAAWDRAFAKVTDLPAVTAAGIRAKAYALKLAIVRENATRAVTNEPIDDIPIEDLGHLDAGLGMSLCRNILALGRVS